MKEFVLAVMDEKLSKREEGRLFEAIEKILGNVSVLSFPDFI